MKKFMLLFVAVFMLSGCASDVLIQLPDGRLVPGPKQSKMDPNLRDAAEFTGTFGTMAGCWAKYGPLAGLGCAVLGNKVTRAVVGEDYAAKSRVAVRQVSFGQDYYPQGGYVGRPPLCYDQGSGGSADCDEYYNRYNGVSYNRRLKQEKAVRRAVYNASQEVPRTRNMFERPEMRAQQAQSAPQDTECPTINDYMSPKWAQAIPEDCRKGNWGHDSVCLALEAGKLDRKQHDCEADGSKCNLVFNFGQMAYCDRKLSKVLRVAQDRYVEK